MERPRYSWSTDRVVPVLGARSGGPAERFADRLRGRHPAAVFLAALLTGLATLAVILWGAFVRASYYDESRANGTPI